MGRYSVQCTILDRSEQRRGAMPRKTRGTPGKQCRPTVVPLQGSLNCDPLRPSPHAQDRPVTAADTLRRQRGTCYTAFHEPWPINNAMVYFTPALTDTLVQMGY